MRTVHEVAQLASVSVRTLHYYDEIGLLRPDCTTEAGYRLYGEAQLERLQQILFFRELDFPLRQIARILDDPAFDRQQALRNHQTLLAKKRQRLDALLGLIDNTLKGESTMSFQEFDRSEIDALQKQYAEEVKERWGATDAYRESQQKAGYTPEAAEEAEKIYAGFVACMPHDPGCAQAQQLVADWQAYITRHFYTCTKEILAGLGEMYVGDERFTANIDRHAPGLAAYMSHAIALYCAK